MSIDFKNNDAAAQLMQRFGLEGAQETLMEDWLDCTHSIDHMPWRNYLLAWGAAKDQFLFRAFGEKLIHKIPFSATKSDDDIYNEMVNDNKFQRMVQDVRSYIQTLVGWVVEDHFGVSHHYSSDIACGIAHMWSRDIERSYNRSCDELNIESDPAVLEFFHSMMYALTPIISTIIDARALASNSSPCAGRFQMPGNSKPFQYTNGQKPMKVITSLVKYLAPYVKNKGFIERMNASIEELRLRHSQFLNTKNFHGSLVLSLHPMDFMTMSDNGCDWRSCMRWTDDEGEFHAGTLEMMNSPSVLVAYLESKSEWHPIADDRVWSNKKWRELFILTEDFIAGVKGYPYESATLEDAVLNALRDLVFQNTGIQYESQILRSNDGGITRGVDACGWEDTMWFHTNVMYNDTEYTVVPYVLRTGLDPKDLPQYFEYGADCYCIKCGQRRYYSEDNRDDDPGRLICLDCADVRRCCYCGDYHDVADMIEVDGQWLCRWCYDEHLVTDEVTGEQAMDDDVCLREIRVRYITKDGDIMNAWVHMFDTTLDKIPEVCIADDDWRAPRLVRPLPEDTELYEQFMAAFKNSLSVDFDGNVPELWYEDLEAEKERNAS